MFVLLPWHQSRDGAARRGFIWFRRWNGFNRYGTLRLRISRGGMFRQIIPDPVYGSGYPAV